jgi:mRNA-degrading endonuclease RelE of RelBE toxin-antitoxin system
MVIVEFDLKFQKNFKKIKNNDIQIHIKKQITKIISNPEIGKPMRYERKDTRELYISPYRLAYAYISSENKIIFLSLYHKDEQ